MSTQEFIQNTLTEAAGLSVQFYAYYWGKYELIPVSDSIGYSIFAQATSLALDRKLSYKGNKVFLHMDGEGPIPIAENVQVFFQRASDFGTLRIYDSRPSYQSLFTTSQMYVSDFSDPEDFEEVEAYVSLLKGIEAHFGELIGIKSISGEEFDEKKKIHLRLNESEHTIVLHKALFDLDILNALNDILVDQFKLKETLHLSIDSKMRMVILKLDQDTLEKANRMGLIV